jgi:hypothetical protein
MRSALNMWARTNRTIGICVVAQECRPMTRPSGSGASRYGRTHMPWPSCHSTLIWSRASLQAGAGVSTMALEPDPSKVSCIDRGCSCARDRTLLLHHGPCPRRHCIELMSPVRPFCSAECRYPRAYRNRQNRRIAAVFQKDYWSRLP